MAFRRSAILLPLIVILFLLPLHARGEEKRDSIVVSLLTCWPGSEVYELCGHEAIRVRGVADGVPVDSVWNYGVFDFLEPNFVYRFVKGETDYMLGAFPYEWFPPEYVQSGREMLEQDLNLSQAEAMRFLKMLRTESLPENRKYRYNYVRDNCATRVVERLDSAADRRIIYPDKVKFGTFREEMRAYHRDYPWYQFGIDLALGSGIDVPIGSREEMFVPVEMAEKVAGATFEDGRPLVSASRVLSKGREGATLPPTPLYLTPLTVSIVILIIAAVCSFWMWKKQKPMKWLYSFWYGICGLAGCLVAFLVFVSEHEATSPNILILWLNPFQLIFAFSVWSRRMRYVSIIMGYYNILAEGLMLLIWPFQMQSGNIAFFPLIGSTLLLAITYVMVAPRYYTEKVVKLTPPSKRQNNKRKRK